MGVLEKDYHASKTIQGLCIAVSVIFEIPVFHFFRQFIGEVRCQANVCDSAECVCVTADTVLLDANLEPGNGCFYTVTARFLLCGNVGSCCTICEGECAQKAAKYFSNRHVKCMGGGQRVREFFLVVFV